MDHAPDSWRYDPHRRTLTHRSGLMLRFHNALEFEVEHLPDGLTTRALREIVLEAEQVFARERARPVPAPNAPAPASNAHRHRLSLKKKATDPA